MAKVHLAANQGNNGKAIYSRCAAKSVSGGKSVRNTRNTYQFMSSKIVDWKTFKEIPACDRCAHCIDMAYPVYIRQARERGKEIKTLEQWLAGE